MKDDVFIAGKFVNLTVLTEQDAAESAWYRWFNDADATHNMQKRRFPNTPDAQMKFYREAISGRTDKLQLGVWPIDSDELAGVVSLNDIDFISRRAEISMIVGVRRYRQMCYTLESMKLIIDHGFSALNLNRIVGGTISPDWAELLCRTLGFRREGIFRQDIYKNGRYNDVHFVGLLASDYESIREDLSF